MEKLIKYLDGTEMVELPYSDECLITELKKRVDTISANKISMWFCEKENNHGTIFVSVQNVSEASGYPKILCHDTIYLHDINLCMENWKDQLREYQREKNVIKNHFRSLKVTSNFR